MDVNSKVEYIEAMCESFLTNDFSIYKYSQSKRNVHDVNPTVRMLLRKAEAVLTVDAMNSFTKTADSKIVDFCSRFQDYYFNHEDPEFSWTFDIPMLTKLISSCKLIAKIMLRMSFIRPPRGWGMDDRIHYSLQVWNKHTLSNFEDGKTFINHNISRQNDDCWCA